MRRREVRPGADRRLRSARRRLPARAGSTSRPGASASATGPTSGCAAPGPGSTRCDQVGIDVVLHREARGASPPGSAGREASACGPPACTTASPGRDWVGYLGRVGLDRPGSPFYIPSNGRNPGTWGGYPPVYVPVRLAIAYPSGDRVARHPAAGLPQPGVGMRRAAKPLWPRCSCWRRSGLRERRLRVGRRLLFRRGPTPAIATGSSSSCPPAGTGRGPASCRSSSTPLEILSLGTFGAAGRRRRQLRPRTGRRDRADAGRRRPASRSRSTRSRRRCARVSGPAELRLPSPSRSAELAPAPGAPPTWRTDPRAPRTSGPRRCPSPTTAAGSMPSSTSGAGRRRPSCARCGSILASLRFGAG